MRSRKNEKIYFLSIFARKTYHNYMRKLLIFLLLLLPCLRTVAQKTDFEKMTADACACMGRQSMEAMDLARLEQYIDSCSEHSLYYHLPQIMANTALDFNNQEQVTRFAERMGQQLYSECAAYRQYWTERARGQLREKQAKMPLAIGKIERIDRSLDGTRQVFWLRLNTMQLLPFYWLREFDGSARFLGDTQAHLGKRVQILWDNISLYDPTRGKYETLREIQLIEELEAPALSENAPQPPRKWAKMQRQQARKYEKTVYKIRVQRAKAFLKEAKKAK